MTDKPLKPSTLAIHADDALATTPDVAPPLHTSTTFAAGQGNFTYGRNDHPTRRRLEEVLGALEGGHAVAYPSGQAATYAAMRHLRPRRVALEQGYHGTHQILARLADDGAQAIPRARAPAEGVLTWLAPPNNPTRE